MMSVLSSSAFFEGTTLIALLGLIGATAKWLWDSINARIDKRASEMDVMQAELNAREKAFDDKRDSEIAVLKSNMERLEGLYESLSEKVGRQRAAIHLLVAKILKEDPNAIELVLVEGLLGEDFPLNSISAAVSERRREALNNLAKDITDVMNDGESDAA